MRVTRTVSGGLCITGLVLLALAVAGLATWQATVLDVYHTPVCDAAAVAGMSAVPTLVTGLPAVAEGGGGAAVATNVTDPGVLLVARALQTSTCSTLLNRTTWARWMGIACTVFSGIMMLYNLSVLIGGSEFVGIRGFYMSNIAIMFCLFLGASLGSGLYWFGGIGEMNALTPATVTTTDRVTYTGACVMLMYAMWWTVVVAMVTVDVQYRMHHAALLDAADVWMRQGGGGGAWSEGRPGMAARHLGGAMAYDMQSVRIDGSGGMMVSALGEEEEEDEEGAARGGHAGWWNDTAALKPVPFPRGGGDGGLQSDCAVKNTSIRSFDVNSTRMFNGNRYRRVHTDTSYTSVY